jgi:uncharacterized protein YuzE
MMVTRQSAGYVPVRVGFDAAGNAAYILLTETDVQALEPGPRHVCEIPDIPGLVALEFDGRGHLVGIEVLGAQQVLAPDFLARARRRR